MPRAYGRHSHDSWRGVWAMLFFGSFGLLLIFAASPQAVSDPVKMSQIASVALSDDDGGQSMFNLSRLSPGTPVSRCISVRYDGGPGGSEVRIVAQNVTDITAGGASLANHIRVRVSRGTGGNSASCAGFAGSAIYTGSRTVNELAVAGGLGTGWTPTPNQTQTFQVTVWLRSDAPQNAQGARFHADLAWGMVTVGSLPVTPTTPPVVVPTTTPPPVVPTTAPPVPEPTVTPSPVVETTAPQPNANPSPAARTPDTGTETTTPTVAPPAPEDDQKPGGSAGGGSPAEAAKSPLGSAVRNIKNAAAGVAKGITDFTKAAGSAAQGALRKPQYTSVAIGLMFLFLLAQDRFDRRDPKLALAPVTREPYLIFADSAEAAEEDREHARFMEQGGR